jgi:hypothetical protein
LPVLRRRYFFLICGHNMHGGSSFRPIEWAGAFRCRTTTSKQGKTKAAIPGDHADQADATRNQRWFVPCDLRGRFCSAKERSSPTEFVAVPFFRASVGARPARQSPSFSCIPTGREPRHATLGVNPDTWQESNRSERPDLQGARSTPAASAPWQPTALGSLASV